MIMMEPQVIANSIGIVYEPFCLNNMWRHTHAAQELSPHSGHFSAGSALSIRTCDKLSVHLVQTFLLKRLLGNSVPDERANRPRPDAL